jgi:hypothetical protein
MTINNEMWTFIQKFITCGIIQAFTYTCLVKSGSFRMQSGVTGSRTAQVFIADELILL